VYMLYSTLFKLGIHTTTRLNCTWCILLCQPCQNTSCKVSRSYSVQQQPLQTGKYFVLLHFFLLKGLQNCSPMSLHTILDPFASKRGTRVESTYTCTYYKSTYFTSIYAIHLARPTDTLLLSTIPANCNSHLHRHLHRFSTNGQHQSFQTGTDMQRWSINGWRWKRIRASLEMRLIGTRRFGTDHNLFRL